MVLKKISVAWFGGLAQLSDHSNWNLTNAQRTNDHHNVKHIWKN